jgi:hypothetical protein
VEWRRASILNADSETYGGLTTVLGDGWRPERAHSELEGGVEMEVCNAALQSVNHVVPAVISL